MAAIKPHRDDSSLSYHDGAFLDQLAPPLAINGEGRHAIVDLACHDGLGQQIAAGRGARDAVTPTGGHPKIPAIRMRPQKRREIGCRMDMPRPLAQNPEPGKRGHHCHQMAGVMRQHGKVRGKGQSSYVAIDLAAAHDFPPRGLMQIDGAVQHGERRPQSGAGRLDGAGFQPPGAAFQLDAGKQRHPRAMRAGGNDHAVGVDQFLAQTHPHRAIALALVGSAAFVVACVLVEQGLTDSALYSDVHVYAAYAEKMVGGGVPSACGPPHVGSVSFGRGGFAGATFIVPFTMRW